MPEGEYLCCRLYYSFRSGCASGVHEGRMWDGNGRKNVMLPFQGGPKARDMCGVAVAAALRVIRLSLYLPKFFRSCADSERRKLRMFY